MASTTAYTGSVPNPYDDFLGPLFFEPYAVHLAQLLPDNAFGQVLEIACGTGRLTRHLLSRLTAGGRLMATDLSEDMLAVGRRKLVDQRISWHTADAHHLPFADNIMDAVACQFGVMFFKNKGAAFGEVLRVLKPGGRFYFNTWDHLRYNALSNAAHRVMTELFPDDLPPFLEKGPYSFWEKDRVVATVSSAGFTGLQFQTVQLTALAPSVEHCLRGIIEGTPINAYLQERGFATGPLKEKLRIALEPYRTPDGYPLPMQAHVCTAAKP